MNRKMTRLALAGKCGGRGASGLARARPAASSANKPASAKPANPPAELRSISRREIGPVQSQAFQ